MKKVNRFQVAKLTVMSTSIAMCFGSAMAEDDILYRLVQPESSVRLGVGYLTDDAARFGQYRGTADVGAYGLADVSFVSRDNSVGRWLKFSGTNLGLDTRSLRFEYSVQGAWKYYLDYDQTPRLSQYSVNTALVGFGSDVQVVGGSVRADRRLKTEREAIGAGGQYSISKNFDLQVKYRHETKEGNRLSGFFASGWGAAPARNGQYFAAEPIEHVMQQLDVILGYAGDRLQLSGGYYGSYFENENSSLQLRHVEKGSAEGAPPSGIALPPDNYAHQFHLSGGYNFTQATRANFKVAKTFAYQDDSFISASMPGRSNLGGKLETTLMQVGLTSRPLQKLSLVADLRQEDRDDKTPQRPYFTSVNGTFNGFNETRDFRSRTGKLEARYSLPAGVRVTAGVDYDEKKRDVYADRLVTTRRLTEEQSYRIEVSRSMSERLTGALAFVQTQRTGSKVLADTFVSGAAGQATRAARFAIPIHVADRDREKIRLRLDWMPVERLSLQFVGELSDDEYKNREFGPDKGRSDFWSVDGVFQLTDSWQAIGWGSREYTNLLNRSANNMTQAPDTDWAASLSNVTEAFGLGLRGELASNWKVGADVQYNHSLGRYRQSGPGATSSPDDVKYTGTTYKLFTEYTVKKDWAIRVDAVHDVWATNDWLWANYATSVAATSDRTTVNQDTTQETTFVGVSMRYTWR